MKKKLKIVKCSHLNSSNFYFPQDPLKTLTSPSMVFDYLINPASNSTEEIKSRMELIQETIIYAQKKIRKLTSHQITSKLSEDDAQKIYAEWYTDTFSDIKSLAPGQEVSQKVISNYIRIVPKNHSIHVALPSLYKSLERVFEEDWDASGFEQCLKLSGLTSVLDKAFVLIPAMEQEWGLVCVNNEAKVLEFYSSNVELDFKLACRKIEEMLKIIEKVWGYDWEVYETPQQNSKHDSGVFLLLIIKALVLNLPFDFSAESIEYYRTVISHELKTNSFYS